MANNEISVKPGISWSEIRCLVKTYDLLLFRGNDFVSDAIANIERYDTGVGSFTHAGLVIRPSDLPADSPLRTAGDQDKIYVLESTASGKWIDGVPDAIGTTLLVPNISLTWYCRSQGASGGTAARYGSACTSV